MSVTVTTLANGLRVVTDTMPHVESAALGVWIGSGTRSEAAERNGVAHFLEHMLFKGTPRRSARAIAEEIEAVGGSMNAYTGRETTAFHASVLKDDVPLAVDVIADILQHSLFDETELARERTVVLQEIGQAQDTPDDIIFDHFQAVAYPGQALGRPVLGTPETVSALGRGDLVDQVASQYHAGRMVLSAAGNVEHARLVELAERHFGELPAGDSVARPDKARYAGGERREARELEQVHLVLGCEAIAYRDPDYYALAVFSTLFGGGMSSRLFQTVREERGLVYSIYSFNAAYEDGGLFGIYAGTGEEQVRELVPLICDQFARVADDVTEVEIARARSQLKASTLMGLESTANRCEQAARHLLIHGRIIPPAEIVARIEAVDRAAVQRVTRRLLASAPTLAALGPLEELEGLDRIAARLAA